MADHERPELNERMEEIREVFRRGGVKLTPQRLEVFREVAGSAEHPDAEAVFRGVRERMPTISLDTVYRTLWLLHDLGLVQTLGRGRGRARFDGNLRRHHHFVCRRCGLTRDFYSEQLDALPIPEEVGTLGDVEETHVEVRGVCQACATRTKE